MSLWYAQLCKHSSWAQPYISCYGYVLYWIGAAIGFMILNQSTMVSALVSYLPGIVSNYLKGHDPEVSKAPTRGSCFHDMTSNVYMSLWLDQSSHVKGKRSGISGTGPPCSNLRHIVWNGVLSVGQAFFNFLFFGSPPKHQRETYHESNNIGGRPTNFQQASFSIENLQIPFIP